MKTSFKRKRIATVLLSAMVMTCNTLSLSFQAPISTAAAEQAALAEDAVPFDRVDGLEEGSYSPDKVIVLLKQTYSWKYDRLLKKIFSDPMFKEYRVVSDPETSNPEEFRLFVAADLNSTGADAVQKALDYLKTFDEIYYAGPNQFFSVTPQGDVNDPQAKSGGSSTDTSAPAFNKIKLYQAWDITHGSPNFVLANSETMYYNHKDLSNQMWTNPDINVSERHGFNFFKNNNKYVGSVYTDDTTQKGYYHGTMVAGIMAAAGNNKMGAAGVAYGCQLAATMAAGGNDSIDCEDFENMIKFLNRNDILIYNVSMSWNGPETATLNAIKKYKGLFIVCAGNDKIDIDTTPVFPASYVKDTGNMIVVGAVDEQDNNKYNWGRNTVRIAAPDSVVGTYYEKVNNKIESQYAIGSGTSFASPVVAGVAALIWSANPTLTNTQVKNALLNNADCVSKLNGKIQNSRRVNAYKAVKSVSVDAGNYFFRNKTNGRYLDLNTSTNTLIAHDFNAGANQKFNFSQGSLKSLYNNNYIYTDIAVAKNMSGQGYRIIKSVRMSSQDDEGGKEKMELYALAVKTPSSASSEVVWEKYDSKRDNQIWYVEDATPISLSPGVYTFKNSTSRKLLDLVENGSGNLVQHGSNGQENQKWQVISAGNSQYVLKTKSTVFPGRLTNSAEKPVVRNDTYITVELFKNINDSTGQPDGTYRIHYSGSCLCLRVEGDKTENSIPIIFDVYRNMNGFKWKYEKIG